MPETQFLRDKWGGTRPSFGSTSDHRLGERVGPTEHHQPFRAPRSYDAQSHSWCSDGRSGDPAVELLRERM